MDLVSVIIPVYKVERYLCACVDSVLSSTYTKLEVILVDDGSPDNCPEICDTYAAQDARVRVIHQENQGLCAARNAGLQAATGSYIAFVDSDDTVSPYLYEKLVEAIESENADWAACEYTRKIDTLPVDACPKECQMHILEGLESVISVLVCAPAIRKITWTGSYVWNKLYRRKLIINPFLVGCLNVEDLQFNWDYLQNNSKLVIVSSALYFYRVNEESITETYRKSTTDNLAKRSLSMVQTTEQIADRIPSDHTVIKQYMIARAVNIMHGALFRMNAHNIAKQHPDFCRHCSKYIRKHWITVWKETETYNLRAKLPIALFVFTYPVWVLATKVIKG